MISLRRLLLQAARREPAVRADLLEVDQMLRIIGDHERATPGIKALVREIRVSLGLAADGPGFEPGDPSRGLSDSTRAR